MISLIIIQKQFKIEARSQCAQVKLRNDMNCQAFFTGNVMVKLQKKSVMLTNFDRFRKAPKLFYGQ